ncbi:MFS transporter [Frankia sp. Cas3]|uniref:MFS transporter n=1 Tax=Frankia sp. Cas3 TaxID=3073926 RepID=UPI002AD287E1|nr:MFS transporter [Frankia sp. Cas3]
MIQETPSRHHTRAPTRSSLPSDRYAQGSAHATPAMVVLTCLVGMFSTTFTATVLTVSVRTVATDLHSTAGVITWAVTGGMLAQAVAMPILGRVGDIRGHRRTFLVGIALAIVFSVLSALAWNALSLIAFRTAAQLAGAATIPSSFAILFEAFPPAERIRPSAWASGVLAGASVSGLAIGGLVISSIGWRPLFAIQACLALLAFVSAIRVLPADRGNAHLSLDRAGSFVLAMTAFALTFGVNRAAVWGARPVVIGLLAAVPVLAWILVRTERRAAVPVIPLQLLAERDIRASGVASFMIGAAHLGNFLVTPLLLEGVFGLSIAVTSLVTMARTLSISLSAPSASRLGSRFGPRRLAVAGAAAYVVALGLLAAGTQLATLWMVIVGLMASGLAFGHAQPPLLVIAGSAAPADSFGLSISLQQTAIQIGAVTGMSLLSAIVADSVRAGPFVAAYLLGAALAVLGCIAAHFCSPTPLLPTREGRTPQVELHTLSSDGDLDVYTGPLGR